MNHSIVILLHKIGLINSGQNILYGIIELGER